VKKLFGVVLGIAAVLVIGSYMLDVDVDVDVVFCTHNGTDGKAKTSWLHVPYTSNINPHLECQRYLGPGSQSVGYFD